MRHLTVSVSPLHDALVRQIERREGGRESFIHVRLRKSKNPSIWARNACTTLALVARLVASRGNSVLYISHPYSLRFALFALCSKRVRLYDDGVLYYATGTRFEGFKIGFYLLLSRRLVSPQTSLAEMRSPRSLLQATTVDRFYALFPHLLPASRAEIVPIAVPGVAGFDDTEGMADVAFFLDTRSEIVARTDIEIVLRYLKNAADATQSRVLLYKPHPSQVSPISRRLKSLPWARRVDDDFESVLPMLRLKTLISFFSSGAISARFIHPNARIICLYSRSSPLAPEGLRDLFDALDAEYVSLPEV